MIGKSIFPTVSFDIQPHSSVVNLKVASVFLLSGHKINENQKNCLLKKENYYSKLSTQSVVIVTF